MAQTSRNSIAVVGVVRMGGGNKWMIDSCTHIKSERISCIGQKHESGMPARSTRTPGPSLAFTRYCNAQYCMVHGVKTNGRKGVEYCRFCNSIASVWAMQVREAIKEWLIRAQKPRSERISCTGQVQVRRSQY